ncbi:MAG: methionyl-tRNA formyltransferase [Culicoidibacterales bacterium]
MSKQPRIVFMGTPEIGASVLQQLIDHNYHIVGVVSQPDRPVGRKKELLATPVKKVAEKYEIPVFQPEKIRHNYQPVLDWNPDVIITTAYGQIVPDALLYAPKYKAINVHTSLLPKYRGGAPIHHAILNGDQTSGVTIMYMVDKLDAGDMLAQSVVAIQPEMTMGELHDELMHEGARLLLEMLPKFFNDEITAIPQDESQVTLAPNISREMELIDWEQPANVVHNQIRGLSPWPVAHTKLGGQNFKIWQATFKTTQESADVVAGTITIDKKTKQFSVYCGDGKMIDLQVVQPAGKQKQEVNVYLNGLKEVPTQFDN